MVEIEFSVMEGNPGDSQSLLPILEAFEKQYYTHVHLTGVPWDKGWGEIAKFGIYGSGPDVSSIGTTWIGSLAAMQALRPFQPPEIKALGGAEAFFEASWHTGLLPRDPTPWAIPWLADVHVTYYWKDILEKAGVKDVETAFSSQAALCETLERVRKDGGREYPLVLTTMPSPVVLHEAAHWVWSAGGDFVAPNGRKVIFNEQAALEGLQNYFSLQQYISPDTLGPTPRGLLFSKEQAAVYFAGPYLGNVWRARHPETGDRLGIARSQGPTFVGGSSFVVWQYTRHPKEAFDLVRFLSSQPTRIPASPHDQGLPTRREALNMPSVEHDVFHRTYLEALQQGRGFPTIRLWGSVEDKLVSEIATIWSELFADPKQDLRACLHKHFDPLAERLNVILGN